MYGSLERSRSCTAASPGFELCHAACPPAPPPRRLLQNARPHARPLSLSPRPHLTPHPHPYPNAHTPHRTAQEGEPLPLVFLPGGAATIEEQARAIVDDLLDDDVDEAELPARAMRRPVVFAAAVQSQ